MQTLIREIKSRCSDFLRNWIIDRIENESLLTYGQRDESQVNSWMLEHRPWLTILPSENSGTISIPCQSCRHGAVYLAMEMIKFLHIWRWQFRIITSGLIVAQCLSFVGFNQHFSAHYFWRWATQIDWGTYIVKCSNDIWSLPIHRQMLAIDAFQACLTDHDKQKLFAATSGSRRWAHPCNKYNRCNLQIILP